MDLKQIKELIAALDKSNLKRIRIKRGNKLEIELEKLTNDAKQYDESKIHHNLSPYFPHSNVNSNILPPPNSQNIIKTVADEENILSKKAISGAFIKSPMVGTFYTSSSPDDPPFIKEGDKVTKDTIVCIVEAMKVMNEVKAGVNGKIKKMMLKNGEPVEFGTKIFHIE